MIFDGTNVNFLIAFLGGIITFFASCFLPLVPTYIAYLSGISSKPDENKKKELLINSVLFALGFIVVFILMGLTANSLGYLLRRYRLVIQKVGGVFLTLIGLFMFGIFKQEFLYRERRLNLDYEMIKKRKLKSFLFGITFGFAWSPCIGPVLAVIIFWASQAATMTKGMLLLASYGLGLGVPFIIIGLFFEKLSPIIKLGHKTSKILNYIAATLITITGILLLTGKLQYYTITLTQLIGIIPHGI